MTTPRLCGFVSSSILRVCCPAHNTLTHARMLGLIMSATASRLALLLALAVAVFVVPLANGSNGANLVGLSNKACKLVCDTSDRLMQNTMIVDKIATRTCDGQKRTPSCCSCLELGYHDGDGDAGVGDAILPSGSLRGGIDAVVHNGDSDGAATDNKTPKPAFLHVCIPTTSRVYNGKDVDFLNIVLQSFEEQVLDQMAGGQHFSGVRASLATA